MDPSALYLMVYFLGLIWNYKVGMCFSILGIFLIDWALVEGGFVFCYFLAFVCCFLAPVVYFLYALC